MKKNLALVVVFTLVALSILKPNVYAYNGQPNSGDYSSDSTITINLTANPRGSENAVSINLLAEGMTILSYTPPANSSWIGNTSDCDNNQVYTSERVCTSMAKSDSIIEGESLGTITVKVKGSTYATLTKTSDNAYSDGEGIRNDEGNLVEFNKSAQPAQSSNQNINLSFSGTQPIILLIALIVIVLLVGIMVWPKLKRKLVKSDTTSSSPF